MQYCPLTPEMLQALGEIEGFAVPTWSGPALTGPADAEAVEEVLAVAGRLLAAAQTAIQVRDATSEPYTLNGVTATAERFMYGPEPGVEAVAALRALVVTAQNFIEKAGLAHVVEVGALDLAGFAARLANWLPHGFGRKAQARGAAVPATGDYSAYALEDARQYAMAWTNLHDIYRWSYRHLDDLVANAFDPRSATEAFWPMLARSALPYNLLVLRKLDAGNAEPFRAAFGSAWTPSFRDAVAAGRLYGIDMSIFRGCKTRRMANDTIRFTPATMTLLMMADDKTLQPVAIHVADPSDSTRGQSYAPTSPAWVYALVAARTSLTVHGIWLGHVYPLHLMTAAMQMTMWQHLPDGHALRRMLGPHSHATMAFNFLLAVGWNQLAPPTSIADTGAFLALSDRYVATHDFFSNDPDVALAALGLEEDAFTQGNEPWDLYPNVRLMRRLWSIVADYVRDAVDDLYPTDAVVADDADLAAWIDAASAAVDGNVPGLPQVDTRATLAQVLTSLLYRVIFHGMGRLRGASVPEAQFAPNFPPCLQSDRIPRPDEAVSTADLLRDFLPRTGTIGELLGFYNLFSFTAPAVPLVPNRGPEADMFFAEHHPNARNALVAFRKNIESLVRELQPEWVEIGQWPMRIEF